MLDITFTRNLLIWHRMTCQEHKAILENLAFLLLTTVEPCKTQLLTNLTSHNSNKYFWEARIHSCEDDSSVAYKSACHVLQSVDSRKHNKT